MTNADVLDLLLDGCAPLLAAAADTAPVTPARRTLLITLDPLAASVFYRAPDGRVLGEFRATVPRELGAAIARFVEDGFNALDVELGRRVAALLQAGAGLLLHVEVERAQATALLELPDDEPLHLFSRCVRATRH
jgi:hypothetical protein